MRWLLDEMLPPATADELVALGHDALAVVTLGLAGAADGEVLQRAVDEDRVVVTENFADFATLVERRTAADEPVVPVVFVRKSALPAGPGLAFHLAEHLDAWARANPEPYAGVHWP